MCAAFFLFGHGTHEPRGNPDGSPIHSPRVVSHGIGEKPYKLTAVGPSSVGINGALPLYMASKRSISY